MRCDDLSGGDFERRKQRCRAMRFVVVALAGQGAAIGQLQIALRGLLTVEAGISAYLTLSGTRIEPHAQALEAAREVAQRFASWRPAIEQALFEHYEPYSEAVTADSVAVFCFHEDGALNSPSFHRAAAIARKSRCGSRT